MSPGFPDDFLRQPVNGLSTVKLPPLTAPCAADKKTKESASLTGLFANFPPPLFRSLPLAPHALDPPRSRAFQPIHSLPRAHRRHPFPLLSGLRSLLFSLIHSSSFCEIVALLISFGFFVSDLYSPLASSWPPCFFFPCLSK